VAKESKLKQKEEDLNGTQESILQSIEKVIVWAAE
jgi:hypothetical protein